jgi:hypothetical protein
MELGNRIPAQSWGSAVFSKSLSPPSPSSVNLDFLFLRTHFLLWTGYNWGLSRGFHSSLACFFLILLFPILVFLFVCFHMILESSPCLLSPYIFRFYTFAQNFAEDSSFQGRISWLILTHFVILVLSPSLHWTVHLSIHIYVYFLSLQ